MRNCIITGFHRSGTTLICHLLNKLPNVVALDEPLDISVFHNADDYQVRQTLDDFFRNQRLLIRDKSIAYSKSCNGIVPSNQLGDSWTKSGRLSLIDGYSINVSNVIDHSFDIYIKHPAVFTAMLHRLENWYPCCISIRNPLAILLSWRATPFNVSKGRAPAAEMIDQDLRARLDREDNILERQFILLDFFFCRYAQSTKSHILRYEDIILSGGNILSKIDHRAKVLSEPLVSRNNFHLSRDSEAREVAIKLLKRSNACWNFYSHDDVAALIGL